MKQIATAVAAAFALLAAGCASESPAPETPEERVEVGETGTEQSKKAKRERNKVAKKERTQGDGSSEEASAAAEGAEGGSGGEDRDEEDATTGGSGTRNGGTAPNYPSAGSYTFAQSGYEEFCDTAGRCDKERLPGRQPVKLTYKSRSDSSAVVVSEQKASRSRVSRTWTKFTPSGAHITKVYVRFEYSGFTFERTYVPQPAVEAFRFPLRPGTSWNGRWRASTSGSYRARVGERREVQVGERTVTAYPVQTVTEFRGDFEGKSRITTYVDPRTKAIVAADGILNVTSQFGRYTTVFETKLLDGPGY